MEADDVIGTLAEQAREAGLDVLVCTGDKDMAQLVDERVTMVNTMDDPVLDAAGGVAKPSSGCRRRSIVDYLALVGDTVDNVPGVPKVGTEDRLEMACRVRDPGKPRRARGRDQGQGGGRTCGRASIKSRSRRSLVTIRRDVALDVGPLDLELVEPDTGALKTLYGELEFRTWLGGAARCGRRRAGGGAPPRSTRRFWTRRLSMPGSSVSAPRTRFAVRHRDDKPRLHAGRIWSGVSFAVEPGHAAYVPFGHDYPGAPEQLASELVLGKLRPILESGRPAKIGQNLKYDMSVLARAGIALAGRRVRHHARVPTCSTAPRNAARHGLAGAQVPGAPHHPLRGHRRQGARSSSRSIRFQSRTRGPYAAEDADVTLRLHRVAAPAARGACVPRRVVRQGGDSPWCRCSRASSATACGSTSGG